MYKCNLTVFYLYTDSYIEKNPKHFLSKGFIIIWYRPLHVYGLITHESSVIFQCTNKLYG